MRSRTLPAVLLLLLSLGAAGCAVGDDDVETGGTSTSTTEPAGSPVEETSTTEPDGSRIRVSDVAAAFEEEGYDVDDVTFDAPSASPDGALGHGGLSVTVEQLDEDVTVELWEFADAEAARAGAEDVADEVGSGTGGAFAVSNASIVALFSCTCEADSEVASVFDELDLTRSGSDEPSEPTTPSLSIPRDLPDPEAGSTGGSDPDERLEEALDALEGAGVDVVDVGDETEWTLSAEAEASVEVELEGEDESLEVHVFADRETAQDAAAEVTKDSRDECGDCEALLTVGVVVDDVVFVVLEGTDLYELLSEIELA